jgi:tRNA 2-thiouridine synthesizing protein A
LQELDARGLDCPMPLLKAKRALNAMRGGERLKILATDKGSVRDFEVFARQSGNTLISSEEENGVYVHVIEKKSAGSGDG